MASPIACPACGTAADAAAQKCPQCGKPLTRSTLVRALVGLFSCAVIVISIVVIRDLLSREPEGPSFDPSAPVPKGPIRPVAPGVLPKLRFPSKEAPAASEPKTRPEAGESEPADQAEPKPAPEKQDVPAPRDEKPTATAGPG